MMLHEQTIMKMQALKLFGMAKGFEDQMANHAAVGLGFEERLGLLVDLEVTYRDNQRLKRLLKAAKLKTLACVEDIDYRHNRGLVRSEVATLVLCTWVEKRLNLLLTGPTGCGKTWLACAFGNQTCRQGKTVLFQRLPLLLEELGIAHADGSFRKRLAQLAKVDLLILDDFGLKPMTQEGRADLLEVIESRTEGRSTLITSQLPVENWHDYLSEGNPTVADALLDRLVSGAIRIKLRGESMRKRG